MTKKMTWIRGRHLEIGVIFGFFASVAALCFAFQHLLFFIGEDWAWDGSRVSRWGNRRTFRLRDTISILLSFFLSARLCVAYFIWERKKRGKPEEPPEETGPRTIGWEDMTFGLFGGTFLLWPISLFSRDTLETDFREIGSGSFWIWAALVVVLTGARFKLTPSLRR